MSDDSALKAVRQEIDAIDAEILDLISARAECSQKVAEIKLSAKHDDQSEVTFYRPEREAQVLRDLMARNRGPLDNDTVAILFREIMSACLALEQPLKVAYLGPEGTFTQAAVLKYFGHASQVVPMGSIDEVFSAVVTGESRFGVVPVENSTEGVVNHTLDMFLQSSLNICGEVVLRIHHNLLGLSSRFESVGKVIAHQQSLAQCRQWLDKNLPNAERQAVNSNAEAARLAAGDVGTAAIAPAAAAEIYQLNILANSIEDKFNNTTRFLIVGQQDIPPSGHDKTSILFAAPNKPGALYDLLRPLAEHHIDMSRLESRPSKGGLWEYVFFVDFDGHQTDPTISRALNALAEKAPLYRVLGSYPKALY